MKDVIVFKVDKKVKIELIKCAKEMGITLSELMRIITNDFLKNLR
jgi:antitoxin component of RelBE/YafQ-DinJ toxin-antitoxin module